MREGAHFPLAARALVAAVIGAAGLALVEPVSDMAQWRGTDVSALAVLVLATASAERFQLEIRYRRERVTYSLSDAIWTGALFVVRPGVLVIAVAAGVLLGQASQSWSGVKVAFNVSQFALGITAAVMLFQLVGAPPTSVTGWLAAAAAMALFQVVNTLLMGAVIALVEGLPFWRAALAPVGVLHWLGNLALGVLGAFLWVVQPAALPLLVVPVLLAYFSYQGSLEMVRERDQMREMAGVAGAIASSGDLAGRVPMPVGTGAAAGLGETLNRMLQRLEESQERERMFIRETAHELRTPITICMGYLDVLDPVPEPDDVTETFAVVADELDRMRRLVADMTTLASTEDPYSLQLAPFPLDRFLNETVAKAAPLLGERLCMVDAPPRQTVTADAQRLTQALINLLANAADHTPPETDIELRVRRDAARWRFEVRDGGGGLPPGQEEEVFRPFFTGKQSAGSGLGLVIVSSIARAHGGTAGVDNRPGAGASFWVEIPA